MNYLEFPDGSLFLAANHLFEVRYDKIMERTFS